MTTACCDVDMSIVDDCSVAKQELFIAAVFAQLTANILSNISHV